MKIFGQWEELSRIIFRNNTRKVTVQPSTQTTGDSVINIPDMAGSTQNLVLSNQVQLLTGKTLEDTSTAIVDTSDATKQITFNAGGTTGTSTSITAAQTANRVITLPDATTTLVGTDTTQSISNKTIGNTNTVTLKDTLFTLQDDGDATKQLQFQLSGITTGNTRTITVPDANITLVGSATTQTLSNKTLDNTNTVTLKDTLFTLQDDGDTSKQAQFQLSGITTATTRTYTLPDATDTITVNAAIQTLSNKTLAAPGITSGATILNEGFLALRENTGSGTNELRIKAPATLAADYTLTMPVDDGTANQVLSTDGAGILSWASVATAPSTPGWTYSDGSALQTITFTGNGNKVAGINSGGTAAEYKAFAVGTAGTDFAVAHAAGTITFNLPDASGSNRGVVTTGAQTLAGVKTHSSSLEIASGSASVPGLAFSADADGSGTGIFRVGANSLGFSANGTNIGQYSSAGLWTLGASSGTNQHVINGQLQVTTPSGTNSSITITQNSASYILERVDATTTLQFRNPGTGLVPFKFDNSSAVSIYGTVTNDNAGAGYVGEYVTAASGGGATPTFQNFPSTNTYGDGASISLTAGDWDITLIGQINFNGGTATAPSDMGISTTTGNSGTGLVEGDNFLRSSAGGTAGDFAVNTLTYRVSLTTTTTHYAKVRAGFSAGTPQYALRIRARRVR